MAKSLRQARKDSDHEITSLSQADKQSGILLTQMKQALDVMQNIQATLVPAITSVPQPTVQPSFPGTADSSVGRAGNHHTSLAQ